MYTGYAAFGRLGRAETVVIGRMLAENLFRSLMIPSAIWDVMSTPVMLAAETLPIWPDEIEPLMLDALTDEIWAAEIEPVIDDAETLAICADVIWPEILSAAIDVI